MFGPWTPFGKLRWGIGGGVLLLLGLVWFGTSQQRFWRQEVDFFQDWASARNVWHGEAAYQSHARSYRKYFRRQPSQQDENVVQINAHPPTSIPFAMPFALLPYPWACVTWNAVSLLLLAGSIWLWMRTLQVRCSVWDWLPIAAVLGTANPFLQQNNQAQFNLLLLFLLTATWASSRSKQTAWAGVSLGTAMAVKFFPGLLLLYFAVRRAWGICVLAIVTFAAWNALAMGLVGVSGYRSYLFVALPEVAQFRDYWMNASLVGWWTRLLHPTSGHVVPWIESAHLAQIGIALSSLLLLAILLWRGFCSRSVVQSDLSFALTVVGMLLLSPLTWDHYFVLLLLPAGMLWVHLPKKTSWHWWLGALIFLCWLNPATVWSWFVSERGELAGAVASVWQNLLWISYPTYVLLGWFVLIEVAWRKAAE